LYLASLERQFWASVKQGSKLIWLLFWPDLQNPDGDGTLSNPDVSYFPKQLLSNLAETTYKAVYFTIDESFSDLPLIAQSW